MKNLDRIWNWKKYPESVFLLVVPLAAIGLGSLALLAIVKLLDGDPWYLVIGIAIGGLGLLTILKLHRTHRNFVKSMRQDGTE